MIFDILVYNGKHLLGTTFQERKDLLNKLYGDPVMDKPLLHKISENVYKTIPVEDGFKFQYFELTKFDMYEGLVLKLKRGLLERGDRVSNNTKTQIKARKETKNYSY